MAMLSNIDVKVFCKGDAFSPQVQLDKIVAGRQLAGFWKFYKDTLKRLSD